MAVMKVIEVLASSKKSWEDAASSAVKEASKSLNNIASLYVQDQSCVIKDGKIAEYRLNVKITFKVGK